ncbi:MAG TPA: hypothetical protein VK014_12890 [Cyclobacteriaceae bacterium]|nr:hypothetical protein [Cyclobacteriaceae bacterium]
MIEYISTFLGIYLMTLFKFIAGPVLGSLAGYSLIEIMIVTVSGMMSSVVIFTFLGEWIKYYWDRFFSKDRLIFTKKNRRIVKVWQKSGAVGVAFLTPLLLTPIGGTLVMTSFGVNRKIIISYMFISAVWWSFFFGLSIEKLLQIPFFERLFL